MAIFPWAEPLSPTRCITCCTAPMCTVECISMTFSGSLVLPEDTYTNTNLTYDGHGSTWHNQTVVVSADATTLSVDYSLTTSANLDLTDVTFELLPIYPTEIASSGSANVGAISASGGETVDSTFTGSGTGAVQWSEALAFYTAFEIYHGDPVSARIHVVSDAVSESPNTVGTLFDVGHSLTPELSASFTSGTSCISFFDRAVTLSAITGHYQGDVPPAGDAYYLDDGTFTLALVKARLKLENLVVGEHYLATLTRSKRLRGTSDPWVAASTVDIDFTAAATTEFTEYFPVASDADLLADFRAYEFTVTACTVDLFVSPALTCADYYDMGYAQSYGGRGGCQPCDDGSGGCPGGDPESMAQCWLDGWTAANIEQSCE